MVNELSEATDQNLVSIYMPTHRVGREMQQDPIRLKNLLSKAREGLGNKGLRKPEIEDLLRPAESLLTDSSFWQHQSDGLAIFVSPDFFRYYRLPANFEDLLVIAERFHLKPLYPVLSGDGQFYILALSQNDIRLLHGSRFSIAEVDLGNVPTSLQQALWFEDPERQLQYHTGTAAPGGAGGRPSIFHGHGVSDEDEKSEILLRYFQRVDKGLMELLSDERYPLLLAGVDYLLPIYQQANSYPHLVDTFIEGNPDELSAAELHQQAWEIIRPIFRSDQRKALEYFEELHGSGSDLASTDLESVIPAAHYGRVETLFVALDVQHWGKYDPQNGLVERHSEFQPGDQDLLDLAAMQTRLNGGTVYALDPEKMPAEALLAAVYRYAYEG
jgi:hypothetical protein